MLVAAAQVAHRLFAVMGFNVEALDHVAGPRLLPFLADKPHPADGGKRGDIDVFTDGAAQHQAGFLAIFRHVGNTAVDGLARRVAVQRLVTQADRAAVGMLNAEDKIEKFAAARAHQPIDAQDLTVLKLQADIFYLAAPTQAVDLQQDLFAGLIELGELAVVLAADNVFDQLLAGNVGDIAFMDIGAVAENGVAVRDLEYLGQTVGDVDNAFTFRRQLLKRLKDFCASSSPIAEVGSSMMMMSALACDSALAISTSCCSATLRLRIFLGRRS